MKKTVDKIPFLRLTAALSAGIVLGTFLQADGFLIYILLILTTAFLLLLNMHYGYKNSVVFGLGVHLFFIAVGVLLINRYNKKPEFIKNGRFVAVVKEILQEKTNSWQSVVRLESVVRNDSLLLTREDLMVYFEKDDRLKDLFPGQTIVFSSSPREIYTAGNPFEFNYKKYMERKRIYRQVYLASDNWLLTDKTASFNLFLFAEKVRMHLLTIYRQQAWSSPQLNVISALTLGYKRGLSPETKNTFSSAGAMHVLAVSGLHTGIVFLALNFLFGFLKKQPSGRFVFTIAVIASLWSFAFLTGLSPSVMRAATMFSFVVVGQNLRRQANIYNTLAASAFFLLLVNPNNLFEVGFQLSYSAVFGIVFLQPRLEKLMLFRLKIFTYFWRLLTVSVAAQIATFPLAVFYFNQFPFYFWLSNLVVIPAVTLLIPLGFLILLFSGISYISTVLSALTGIILTLLLDFLEWIKQLPFSVVNFYISEVELLFILSALLSLFFFIELQHKMYFKSILLFILLVMSSSLLRQTAGLFQNKIINYDYPGQHVVHLISGKRNYIVSEKLLNDKDKDHSLIQNTVLGLQLHRPLYLTCSQAFNDSVLYLNDGFILFQGQIVHFHIRKKSWISPFIPDITIGQAAFLENQ